MPQTTLCPVNEKNDKTCATEQACARRCSLRKHVRIDYLNGSYCESQLVTCQIRGTKLTRLPGRLRG